ncbi:transcriptional regulator [Enterobacter hormaechei subsp. steigerwaltii]|uniref:Transcriptional regulator n=1 Tax=Salmonella montevideo TaxID=115981 RepID=A0A752C580_SALMO|nr:MULTISPECIES: transcriptional regulator [Enterobacteriaceae]MCU2634388.1 transcriptional regulator [Enterobacter hormaechei subsp. hoffmannii]HAF7389011.1 transcriptional regulator [Salmonella enterica subsp. enterica serovar Montevideo]KJL72136.1 transcriptional regulator [Enterobacter hormaechei subsp. steigerwaltii]KJL79341.1 transcriptional regulator [Enterobacter hormaechei subsp. steigerwaltii]KJL80331.1 transcriptional regulator [Enterobacter hormaechei subsp. steigerwaltii]
MITYGVPAEVWPRDYSNVEHTLMFWRARSVPVKVTMEDGQVFNMYIQGTLPSRNKLDLSPAPRNKEHRVRLPIERVSTIETIIPPEVEDGFTGRLTIHPDYGNNQPSRRDFFRICRQAHETQKSIRVYVADGREIEGVSLGVDACQVTMRIGERVRMIALFDWVERILPF